MYDTDVCIECTVEGAASDCYQITESTLALIAGKAKMKGKVEVKLLKTPDVDVQEIVTCTLKATPKERTTKAEVVEHSPKYFANGQPSTSSLTSYETLGRDVFVGLDEDGSQLSVCITKNNKLARFKNGTGNVVKEYEHLKRVFAGATCNSTSISVTCSASDYSYYVESNGSVRCDSFSTNNGCGIGGDGWVGCS